MKSFEQIAKAMYAAYRRHIQTVIGVNPPAWGADLPTTERQAWISAAQEAHKEIAEASEKKAKRQNLLAEVGEAYAPSDKSGMLDTARLELEMLRNALGVSVEPHQTLFDRMIEAAQAKRADARDAERYLDYLIRNQARVRNNLDEYEGYEDCADCGYWLEFTDSNSQTWVQIGVFKTPRDAIDAAIAAAKGE